MDVVGLMREQFRTAQFAAQANYPTFRYVVWVLCGIAGMCFHVAAALHHTNSVSIDTLFKTSPYQRKAKSWLTHSVMFFFIAHAICVVGFLVAVRGTSTSRPRYLAMYAAFSCMVLISRNLFLVSACEIGVAFAYFRYCRTAFESFNGFQRFMA